MQFKGFIRKGGKVEVGVNCVSIQLYLLHCNTTAVSFNEAINSFIIFITCGPQIVERRRGQRW